MASSLLLVVQKILTNVTITLRHTRRQTQRFATSKRVTRNTATKASPRLVYSSLPTNSERKIAKCYIT